MIDLGLIAAAKKAVLSKPRHFVTAAHILAVVDQESHCANTFIDTKPGSQYALNVSDAILHKVRDRNGKLLSKIPTGLKEAEIRSLVTLPAEIDGWKVPVEFAGQKAKFRFEYGYWKRYPNLPKEQRFKMSCSWGMVQFMAPNITNGKTDDDAIKYLTRFACDVPLQLLYCAGEVDRLLTLADGDMLRAYKGYNSGNVDSEDPAVIARAKAVEANYKKIDAQLKLKGAA